MSTRILSGLLFLSSALTAQTGTGIFGTVTDSSGSVVGNASLTVTNDATGVAEKTKSNTDGYYIFLDLRPGSYHITCSASGFGSVDRTGILLEVDRRARVDVALRVGEMKQVMEVQGAGTTVDTASSTVKEVVDAKRMDELPLNGRNALSLQAILPGSIQMGSGSAATGTALNTNLVFSVNGTRASQSSYVLDGGLNMEMYNNVPAAFPNPDNLQEFSILQNGYSAVNGRNAGAVINMVTKSGTNQLHGVLYDFIRNNDMDARNFFSPIVSPLHRNQFGGNFGGPVIVPKYKGKDRTFFFFGFEAMRQVLGATSSGTVVPTSLERTGDFSQSAVRGKLITVAPPTTVTIANPTGVPYPNNVIPPSQLDPVALNFTKAFLPLPNSPGNIYTFNLSLPTNDYQVVTRIDHSISDKNKLNGRPSATASSSRCCSRC